MKCWKCGQEIDDGTTECIYCHTDQRRSTPTTDIGLALRKLYDRYGAEQVLTNPVLLSNGLGDVVNDTLGTNVKKLKAQLKMVMDAGIGHLYKERIVVGNPDSTFYSRAKTIITEDAGLSEKTAEEIIGYFDEMIGWQNTRLNSLQLDPKPTEKPIREENPQNESEYSTFQKSDIYEKALSYFRLDTLLGFEEALLLFQKIPGYRSADNFSETCRIRIAELKEPDIPPAPLKKGKKWVIPLLILLIIGSIYYLIHNERTNLTKTPAIYPSQTPISDNTSVSTSTQKTTETQASTSMGNPDFEIVNGVLEKYQGIKVHVVIPDNVKSIGEFAFNNCKYLQSIYIPNSVTSIGNYAFQNCSSLKSINIPDSVKVIGEQAFAGCSSLRYIDIPSNVSIDIFAFSECYSLKSVTIPNGVTFYGNIVFEEGTTLKVPHNSSAERWCKESPVKLTCVTY